MKPESRKVMNFPEFFATSFFRPKWEAVFGPKFGVPRISVWDSTCSFRTGYFIPENSFSRHLLQKCFPSRSKFGRTPAKAFPLSSDYAKGFSIFTLARFAAFWPEEGLAGAGEGLRYQDLQRSPTATGCRRPCAAAPAAV